MIITLENVEDMFVEFSEDISARIERGWLDVLDESDFEEFKPFIKNWDVVVELVREENEEGYSDKWNDIEFVKG